MSQHSCMHMIAHAIIVFGARASALTARFYLRMHAHAIEITLLLLFNGNTGSTMTTLQPSHPCVFLYPYSTLTACTVILKLISFSHMHPGCLQAFLLQLDTIISYLKRVVQTGLISISRKPIHCKCVYTRVHGTIGAVSVTLIS